MTGSATDHVNPGEFLLAAGRQLGGPLQRVLGPFVFRAQELHPADFAPAGGCDVVAPDLLGEGCALVERSGAFLVPAPRRVNECAAKADEGLREQLALTDRA